VAIVVEDYVARTFVLRKSELNRGCVRILKPLENFALAQSKRIILREEKNFVQVVERDLCRLRPEERR
jgi:hypothetical protein